MEKHIEINCFEFGEYTLEQRARAISLQMGQYIKMLAIVIKHLEEKTFQIDFLINEGVGEELEATLEIDYKTDIEKEFFIKYEDLMKHFTMYTNKISFKIIKRVLI